MRVLDQLLRHINSEKTDGRCIITAGKVHEPLARTTKMAGLRKSRTSRDGEIMEAMNNMFREFIRYSMTVCGIYTTNADISLFLQDGGTR